MDESIDGIVHEAALALLDKALGLVFGEVCLVCPLEFQFSSVLTLHTRNLASGSSKLDEQFTFSGVGTCQDPLINDIGGIPSSRQAGLRPAWMPVIVPVELFIDCDVCREKKITVAGNCGHDGDGGDLRKILTDQFAAGGTLALWDILVDEKLVMGLELGARLEYLRGRVISQLVQAKDSRRWMVSITRRKRETYICST